MVNHCKKCGQIVQESDVTCWHCGAVLIELTLPQASNSTAVPDPIIPETEISFTAVAFYATVTLIFLLLLWLLVAVMNRQPVYPWHPDISRPPGWTAVTDSQQRFTVNVPADWSVSEPGLDQSSAAAEFSEQLRLASAAAVNRTAVPLIIITAPDISVIIFPIDDVPINYMEALQNTPDVQAIEITQDNRERELVSFTETIAKIENDWRCKTHLLAGSGQPYALFTCQTSAADPPLTDEINTIVTSFQELLP